MWAAWEARAAQSAQSAKPESPGIEKVLRDLLDRAYKIFISSVPSLRVTEQDSDNNDPLVAWMSDVRSVLYRNKPVPDVFRDLQGSGK
jgi:prolyl oligopeptidase PreP (S9A serine peptidase family)